MKIKICGLTRPQDAETAIAAGADLVGFIFVSGTRRGLDAAGAGWVRGLEGAEKVGVFRDATLSEIERIRDELELDWVQLHGAEPDEFLDVLGSSVIRRVPVAETIDWPRVAGLSARCLPLFDPGGGDGRAWPWEVLSNRPQALDFGLAGGLDPDNVAEAIRVVRPYLVDVSSGVEREHGVKDPRLISAFIEAARSVGV